MTPDGQIPQSDALSEATPDSLAELMNRDPEHYSRQDRDRIIQALREQRVRWEASESQGAKRPAKPTAAKATSLVAGAKAEDLGL